MVIRTKHFFVGTLALLVGVVVGGGWRVFHDADTRAVPKEAFILGAPKDAYSVVQTKEKDIRDNREAFIEKVRNAVESEPQPVVVETTPPVLIEDTEVATEMPKEETIIAMPPAAETESVIVLPASTTSTVAETFE